MLEFNVPLRSSYSLVDLCVSFHFLSNFPQDQQLIFALRHSECKIFSLKLMAILKRELS